MITPSLKSALDTVRDCHRQCSMRQEDILKTHGPHSDFTEKDLRIAVFREFNSVSLQDAIDEIERQEKVAQAGWPGLPQTSGELKKTEIPLHELDPDALGLDPIFGPKQPDVTPYDAIQKAKQQQEAAANGHIAAKQQQPETLDLQDVPACLKNLPRWIRWKLELNKDGKLTKVPYQVNGCKASSTDQSTWTDFQTAMTGAIINAEQGVGFVVNGDGIFGIDLDGCYNLKTGKIAEWAERIIDACESYTEYTPSGTGLRVWVRGTLPPGARVFNLDPAVGYGDKVKIEVFETTRYFTVTGDAYYEACDVVEIDANKIYQMLHDIRAQHPVPVSEKSATSAIDGDSVPIVYAPGSNLRTDKYTIFTTGRVWKDGSGFHVSNGHGTVTYPSQSEADLAFATVLALFHDRDVNKMDEDFRKSALYREKWEREDYRENTFQKALATANKIKEKDSKKPMDLTAAESAIPTKAQPAQPASQMTTAASSMVENSLEEETIPSFDDTVITGVFRDIVDLATNGTTIPRQFPFLVAKVYIGTRMAGGMTFEGIEDDPTIYGAAVGVTGTSKGISWKRTMRQVLLPEASLIDRKVKILYSFDSGAGLRDAFFDKPQDQPIIGYIDEISSLGHKAGEKKNPEIIDTIIELANSHYISRVKAKRSQKDKAKVNEKAYLSLYMCGQDGEAYMSSFPGRSNMGLWDRFYPEHAKPVDAGKLPKIDPVAAMQLIARLEKMTYTGRMTMGEGVETALEAFWDAQTDVKTRVRFKSHLMLDMYLAAWSQGRMIAEMSDLKVAIRIYYRQMFIRRVLFRNEVPDRVGHYVGLLKQITETMRKRLNGGMPMEKVAMSIRDFQTDTNAYRDNELVTFNTAWRNFHGDHLATFEVTARNGHKYMKYLPMPYEDETWATPEAKAQNTAATESKPRT